MLDMHAFPYPCFVRFDLVEKAFDREFNLHFEAHIQALADRPGYSRAWRTRELRGGDNKGVMEQEYEKHGNRGQTPFFPPRLPLRASTQRTARRRRLRP